MLCGSSEHWRGPHYYSARLLVGRHVLDKIIEGLEYPSVLISGYDERIAFLLKNLLSPFDSRVDQSNDFEARAEFASKW